MPALPDRTAAKEEALEQGNLFHLPESWLVRLRPRHSTVYASQGRSVMATSPDGFVYKQVRDQRGKATRRTSLSRQIAVDRLDRHGSMFRMYSFDSKGPYIRFSFLK